MEERDQQLLSGVVREYVRTGRPVGSAHLAQALGLALSSATVRSVLRRLEESGYLEQPHTSAGRVPTDAGYRSVVDNQRHSHLSDVERQRLYRQYLLLAREYRHTARAVSQLAAQLARTVALSSTLETSDVQEAGLHELLRGAQVETIDVVRELSEVLEALNAYLPQLGETAGSHANVYIGKENPVFPAQHTSLLIRQFEHPVHGRVVVALVGPKRMRYHRNVSLLDALADIIT